MADQITLLVPYGKRPLRVELPLEVARWLRDQLAAALEERQPRKRRPRAAAPGQVDEQE